MTRATQATSGLVITSIFKSESALMGYSVCANASVSIKSSVPAGQLLALDFAAHLNFYNLCRINSYDKLI